MLPKNLLVTGAAGFIASTFAAQRIEAGDTVIAYDKLTYAGHRENLDWIDNADNRLQLVVDDICNRESVLELLHKHEIDYVLNYAAESHVDNSISSPGEFVTTNINGTYALLEAARTYYSTLEGDKKDNFRFLHVSTDEVFGELGETGKFTEATPYRPNSPYSASKASSDLLVRAWHETYGLPTVITNCTNNYGPRQFPEKLIPATISRALAGEPLKIYGNGTNIRDWIHVEDHNRGIWQAITKGKVGETYCFGGNAEKNNIEVVNTICEILDECHPRADGKSYKTQKTFVTDRAGHDFRYAIDDRKAQRDLGYRREFNFSGGIRATVRWYLDNQNWCDAVTNKNASNAA